MKAYLDQVFVRLVERKQQKVIVKFEPYCPATVFNTGLFQSSVKLTQLKGTIAEERVD